MVVTGDDLRGQRVMNEAEVLADVLLDEWVDAGIGTHSTRDGAKGDVLARVDETVEIALELPGPGAELHAEGHGLGVNAVGAAGAEGVALLEGTTLADLAKLADVLNDEVAGLGELVAKGGVAKVGAGHAIVNPTAGLGSVSRDVGVDVLLHVGEEGDDVVAGDLLDLVNLGLLKVGVVADPGGLVLGDANLTKLGLGLASEDLDLLPDGVLVLEREDVAHLRTGITVDHAAPPRVWPASRHATNLHNYLILPREGHMPPTAQKKAGWSTRALQPATLSWCAVRGSNPGPWD